MLDGSSHFPKFASCYIIILALHWSTVCSITQQLLHLSFTAVSCKIVTSSVPVVFCLFSSVTSLKDYVHTLDTLSREYQDFVAININKHK